MVLIIIRILLLDVLKNNLVCLGSVIAGNDIYKAEGEVMLSHHDKS